MFGVVVFLFLYFVCVGMCVGVVNVVCDAGVVCVVFIVCVFSCLVSVSGVLFCYVCVMCVCYVCVFVCARAVVVSCVGVRRNVL